MNPIIEKIKSLLALASDPSTTEHERQLAFSRARTLIERHAVKEQDLSDKPLEILTIPFQPSNLYRISSTLNSKLPWVLQPIAEYFGCFVLVRSGVLTCFVGYKHNIEITQYAANVLLRQGTQDFKKAFRGRVGSEPLLTFEERFWNGFMGAMTERFKIQDTPQTQEISIYDPIKRMRDSIRSLSWTNLYSSDSAGFESGKNAQLHRPLETTTKGNQLR